MPRHKRYLHVAFATFTEGAGNGLGRVVLALPPGHPNTPSAEDLASWTKTIAETEPSDTRVVILGWDWLSSTEI